MLNTSELSFNLLISIQGSLDEKYRSYVTGALAFSLAATVALADPKKWQEWRSIGDLISLGGYYCPVGSIQAKGQVLGIKQNPELFAVFGTEYGGDGKTTFALPGEGYSGLTDRGEERSDFDGIPNGGSDGNGETIFPARCIIVEPTTAWELELYLSEIINVVGACPQGTIPANGNLIPIVTNQQLFALLGRFYGGDGRTTLRMPKILDPEKSVCIAISGVWPTQPPYRY